MAARFVALLVACFVVANGFDLKELKHKVMKNATLYEALLKEAATTNTAKLLKIEDELATLDACPPLARKPLATSIYAVHPYDIGAIGAVGDSITQGCNAKSSTWLNHRNYVGITWNIGGDPGVTTLYNLFRPYTGGIPAPSLGEGTGSLGLNAAVDGAVASNMPAQATELVNRFKAATYINGQTYDTAWKMATLLIGGNNFCKVCNDEAPNNVAQYILAMRQALDILKQVPRLIVNVLPMLDIGPLADFRGGLGCELALRTVCPCVMNAAGRTVVTRFTRDYNAALLDLVKAYPVEDGARQFAVVVQPFLTNTLIPHSSYITPADCFHPSALGQQAFAISIWNNILSPAAQKSTQFTPGEAPMCPNDDTLVYVV